MSGFFFELKRRNVIRAALLYLGGVWAFGQGLSQFSPAIGLPDWATRWFLVAAAVGFPFWIAFAWFYEFTPEGLKRESEIDPADSITTYTGKKLDRWIIAIMGVAIVLLLTNTFVWHKGAGLSADADNMPIPEHSIAVLPFVNMSSDKEQEYFSDGISEDLLNLLAKIPELQVTARTSAFSFKGKDAAQRDIAHQLHVAHLFVGSVRKIGNAVRISAQLVDAATDTQRWSQTWDRKLDDVFAIQDEIAATVVEAVAHQAARRGADGEADRPAGVCADPAGTSVARTPKPEEHGAVDRVEQAGVGDRAERITRMGRAGARLLQSDGAGRVDSAAGRRTRPASGEQGVASRPDERHRLRDSRPGRRRRRFRFGRVGSLLPARIRNRTGKPRRHQRVRIPAHQHGSSR